MSFIDSHREELGVEPICRELAIAPSSYHEHAARLADPGKRSVRVRRDDEIKQQIRRVHGDSSGLYGTRKVWHQIRREGATVAKCTVERLMRAMGLAGVIPTSGEADSAWGFPRRRKSESMAAYWRAWPWVQRLDCGTTLTEQR